MTSHSSAFLVGLALATSAHGFDFTAGDYFTSSSDSSTISQFNQTGAFRDSLTLSASFGDNIRGLQFYSESLYAVAEDGSRFNVLRIDGESQITALYSDVAVYVAGNISYGKIAVHGGYIYVAAQNSLMRMAVNGGDTPSSIFTGNQIFDVEALPSGNLLVASAYALTEITASGAFVRQMAPQGYSFTDIRGVEYDPVAGTVYVTHLGHTGFSFKLMKIDYATGALEDSVTHHYADDLFLTADRKLLVGSRTLVPAVFDLDLNPLDDIGGTAQTFVTQAPVPEPASTAAIFAAVALGFAASRRRKKE